MELNLESLCLLHHNQFSKIDLPVSLREQALTKIIDNQYDCSNCLTIGLIRDTDPKNVDNDEILGFMQYQISASQDMRAGQDVFLIDNWFTFPLRRLSGMLENDLELLQRVEQLIGLSPLEDGCNEANGNSARVEQKTVLERIDLVHEKMWKFVGSYSLNTSYGNDDSMESNEEFEPVWYFMDHYGSHIGWSVEDTEVNVKVCPFIFLPTMASYSLMWLVKPLAAGDELVREHTYAVNATSELLRDIRMAPWNGIPEITGFPSLYEPNWLEVCTHRSEQLPLVDCQDAELRFLSESEQSIGVYSDLEDVKSKLTSNSFQVVNLDNEDVNVDTVLDINCDVIFITRHFKDFGSLVQLGKLVNQFPAEHILFCKDLLAASLRRIVAQSGSNGDGVFFPAWFQRTYNLFYELPRFVFDWKERLEKEDEPGLNLWILKPWNLTRGMATYVTNSLDQIVRMCETSVPLIAQKYIERPLLFYRQDKNYCVKFDMRIFVAVQSMKPLRAYAYREVWVRVANLEYKLEHFYQYERHFSVMAYLHGGHSAHFMSYDTFRQQMHSFYHNLPWEQVILDAHQALREMFEICTARPHPLGVYQCPNSRALYGVDLMVKWTEDNKLQPVILEVNFIADTTKFVQFCPDFYNDVFDLLFVNKVDDNKFTAL